MSVSSSVCLPIPSLSGGSTPFTLLNAGVLSSDTERFAVRLANQRPGEHVFWCSRTKPWIMPSTTAEWVDTLTLARLKQCVASTQSRVLIILSEGHLEPALQTTDALTWLAHICEDAAVGRGRVSLVLSVSNIMPTATLRLVCLPFGYLSFLRGLHKVTLDMLISLASYETLEPEDDALFRNRPTVVRPVRKFVSADALWQIYSTHVKPFGGHSILVCHLDETVRIYDPVPVVADLVSPAPQVQVSVQVPAQSDCKVGRTDDSHDLTGDGGVTLGTMLDNEDGSACSIQ